MRWLSAAFVGLVTRNCLIGCCGLIGSHQFAFPAARLATVHELAVLGFSEAERKLSRTLNRVCILLRDFGMARLLEART